jgi:hypothetical protein
MPTQKNYFLASKTLLSGLSVARATRPPARYALIDLRARPVRVKRALTDRHGKSDLPYPRLLPPRPPRCRASGSGYNGMYGMSGTDPMSDNGKVGADGKDRRARTCTMREHVRREHIGRQLNPFFLKKHPKTTISC